MLERVHTASLQHKHKTPLTGLNLRCKKTTYSMYLKLPNGHLWCKLNVGWIQHISSSKRLKKSSDAECFILKTLVPCQYSTLGNTNSCVSSWHLQCRMSAMSGSEGRGAFPLYYRIAELHRCCHVRDSVECFVQFRGKFGVDTLTEDLGCKVIVFISI